MIVYEKYGSHTTIDMTKSVPLSCYHSLKRGEPVTEVPRVPHYVKVSYENELIEATPGVTAGGHIYFTQEGVTINYEQGATEFVVHPVYQAGGGAPVVPRSFSPNTLSPTTYESCHVAEMGHSRPSGYIATSDGCLFSFPSVTFNGLPKFNQAVLSGANVIALFGDDISVGPMVYAPSTARGALALLVDGPNRFSAFGTVDRYGIYFSDKTQAKNALASWCRGLKISTAWCRNFQLPESDGHMFAETLRLSGYILSGADLGESCILASGLSAHEDWQGLTDIYNAWFHGSVDVFMNTTLQAVDAPNLEVLNAEIASKLEEIKIATVENARACAATAFLELREYVDKYNARGQVIFDRYEDFLTLGNAKLSPKSISGKTTFIEQVSQVGAVLKESSNDDEPALQLDTDKLKQWETDVSASVTKALGCLDEAASTMRSMLPPRVVPTYEEKAVGITQPGTQNYMGRGPEVAHPFTLRFLWWKKTWERPEAVFTTEARRGQDERSIAWNVDSYWPVVENDGIRFTDNQEECSYGSSKWGFSDPHVVFSGERNGSRFIRLRVTARFHPVWFIDPKGYSAAVGAEKNYIRRCVLAATESIGADKVSVYQAGVDPWIDRPDKPKCYGDDVLANHEDWEHVELWAAGTRSMYGFYRKSWSGVWQYSGSHSELARRERASRIRWAGMWFPAQVYSVDIDVPVEHLESPYVKGFGSLAWLKMAKEASRGFGSWLTDRAKELGISDVVPCAYGSGVYTPASTLAYLSGLALDDESVETLKSTIRSVSSLFNNSIIDLNDPEWDLSSSEASKAYKAKIENFIDDLDRLKEDHGAPVWLVDSLAKLAKVESYEDRALLPFYWRFC